MDSTQRTRPRTGGSPVGLVIFIILTVVFAVLAYWGLASYQKADQKAKDLEGKLANAESNHAKAVQVNKDWATIAGVPTPDSLRQPVRDAFETTRNEDIGVDMSDTAKDALAAAQATVSLLKSVQEGLAADVNALTAQSKNLVDQMTATTKTLEDDIAKKIAEKDALQKKMDAKVAELEARIDEEVAAREALRDTYYTERDQWQQAETRYVLHIEELKDKVRGLSGEGTIIEKADATITAIDRVNKLVTMNAGANDGVEQQMRFVAFSRDAKGDPIRKGVVEVVSVSPAVSVARILTVEENMAVGRGDSVYNLAGPTQKLFVFAGTPKLYTIEQWTNFIRANGGEVVGAVQKGDQVADYLIFGEFDEQDPMITQQIFAARDFGLKILKETDLKEWMGLQ